MSTSSSSSFFPTAALDHAFAGIGAGTVSVLCMQPLDLLKVKFQVANDPKQRPSLNPLKEIWRGLTGLKSAYGWQGLYRGLGANVAGNAASWGLYFWFGSPTAPLSAQKFLLASAEASAITALLTNPIWVVKVRLFTTPPNDPNAYRGLWDGLWSVAKREGIRGLYKGTTLALFGVSNGALQFMAYEEMKKWGFARQKRKAALDGVPYDEANAKLSNTAYTMMSGASKLVALTATYPYQVVRSRIQNNAQAHLYPDIRTCVARTWRDEGVRGFYRGLGTNLVRIVTERRSKMHIL
ncbi:glycosyltransferase family 39 protein [Tulasnella calospora MUT 4182]|uniref:Glycosyltransferase family 39 protein n=1 Tax=Tulasnella calospora MUT 4182 TaxID=1051891 RepID=A0A0C3Q4I1_9AGAM|nr:glycosyltransferase family 39 protein [Tulasnella calospora MUT 4182]